MWRTVGWFRSSHSASALAQACLNALPADRDPYRRPDDAACVCAGEVHVPADPAQPGPDLVIEVAELVWEPIAD